MFCCVAGGCVCVALLGTARADTEGAHHLSPAASQHAALAHRRARETCFVVLGVFSVIFKFDIYLDTCVSKAGNNPCKLVYKPEARVEKTDG